MKVDNSVFVLFLPSCPPTSGQAKIISRILADDRCGDIVVVPYAYTDKKITLLSQIQLSTLVSFAFTEWQVSPFIGKVHLYSTDVYQLKANNNAFLKSVLQKVQVDFNSRPIISVFDCADYHRLNVNNALSYFDQQDINIVVYGNQRQLSICDLTELTKRPIPVNKLVFICESSGHYQYLIQDLLEKGDYLLLAGYLTPCVYRYLAAHFENPETISYTLELGRDRGIAPSLCIKN